MTSHVTTTAYPGTDNGKNLELLVTVYNRTSENALTILEQVRLKRGQKYDGNVYPPRVIMIEEVPEI